MKNRIIYIFSVILLAACSNKESTESHASREPKRTNAATANDVMLSDNQIKLANITTQRIVKKEMGETVVINGRLTMDQERTEVISSRVAGRIEKLYSKETGQVIQKGQPLYVLYSEALLTLQQEYLLAKEQYEALGKIEKRYKSFLDAAEKKLLLYGLTKVQIAALTDRTEVQPRVTFSAPSSGVITEIKVSEGQYISEGAQLYTIEDMRNLWVEAELYPGETSLVQTGDKITARVIGDENNPIEATIAFLSPEYQANSLITVMRASLDNPGLNLRPGQHVQLYLSHSARETIVVPTDAVIRDAHGTHLYIQAGHNNFRPQIVKTGLENFDQVEITHGIREGDTVAISGAYLLYSEIVLKNGQDPSTMHSH